MGVVLRKASYSPNIKERRDFSCALFDGEGKMISQAAHIPVHLGSMPLSVAAALEKFASHLHNGDCIILNDPYLGGTHLPDITLVTPVFLPTSSTPFAFVASRAHHADIGGMTPGSMPVAREIFQEGLIIPPIKLVRRGEIDPSVWDLLLANVRTPQERLATWPMAALILDWYHCRKKCYDLTSLICRGRKAKNELLGLLLKHLWRGLVQDALDILEEYRPQSKNIEKLDELIQYLQKRQAFIPNYRERRSQRQYIGSAHVEKANDLIVARRQKHQGMHWSEQTSDALAALRTLVLNGGWDLYWQKHQVLPLAIPVEA